MSNFVRQGIFIGRPIIRGIPIVVSYLDEDFENNDSDNSIDDEEATSPQEPKIETSNTVVNVLKL